MRALLENHQLQRLTAWLALYSVILLGGWAGFYIARRHWPLLWLALGLLVLCLLPYVRRMLSDRAAGQAGSAAAARPLDRRLLLRELPETLAHCVPLLLFIALGPTTISSPTRAAPLRLPPAAEAPQQQLGGTAVDDELLDLPNAPPEESMDYEPQFGHEPYIPPNPAGRPSGEATGGAGYSAATILELPFWDAALMGDQVEIIGMFHRSAAGDWAAQIPEVGSGKPLVYRYLITCCVVDAMPVFAIITGELPADPPADGWVRLRGRFSGMSEGFWSMPLIELHSIEEAAMPLDPYLMY